MVGVDANEDQNAWLYEICTLTLQLVVDLFVKFYDTMNPLLRKVLSLLISFIKRPHQSLAGIGITAFVRLMTNAGNLLSEKKLLEMVLSLKEAAKATAPDFLPIMNELDHEIVCRGSEELLDKPGSGDINGPAALDDDVERLRARSLHFAIADAKCRAAVQLLLIQGCKEKIVDIRGDIA